LHFKAVDEMVAHILIEKLDAEHVECVHERESASCANVAWAEILTARANDRTRARHDEAGGSDNRDVPTGVKAAKRTCEPRRSTRAQTSLMDPKYTETKAHRSE
jgi:hypothetical protein